jgi:hypothetical protein
VRFISHPELTDERLSTIDGVAQVAHDADETVLHTTSVPATISALLELGEQLNVTGLDLAVRRPTLEDVFLSLTGRALRD